MISLAAGACALCAVVSARRRVYQLRSTGETFANRDFSSSFVAILVTLAVVITATNAMVANVGASIALIGHMFAITGCVYLALIDIDTHLLPWIDCIIVGFLSCGFLSIDALLHSRIDAVVMMALSALLTWVIFRCLEWLSRGDLGGGDVVLATVLAAVLGWFGMSATAQAMVVAVVMAGVFALVAMLFSRFHLRTAFAFGPFLIIGALFVMMTADPLWVTTY